MAAIEKWQKGKIYGIAHKLAMVGRAGDREDALHLLVQAHTGKVSIKELTFSEAAAVIAELERLQGPKEPGKPQAHHEPKERPGGITKPQRKKVWALIGVLEKYDACPVDRYKRLCGIIKKELGMDATPSNPFAWLTMENGRTLIDALKRYAEQAERKALREGGAGNG